MEADLECKDVSGAGVGLNTDEAKAAAGAAVGLTLMGAGAAWASGAAGGGAWGSGAAGGGFCPTGESCQEGCVESGASVCFEPDPTTASTAHQWQYVGEGYGSYNPVTKVHYVGAGLGAYEKGEAVSHGGYRCRTCCVAIIGVVLFIAIFLIVRPFFYDEEHAVPFMDAPHDCSLDVKTWQTSWDETKKAYCCIEVYVGCKMDYDETTTEPAVHTIQQIHYVTRIHRVPQKVYVREPYQVQKVVKHVVMKPQKTEYDCERGFDDWHNKWSLRHQRYCCYLRRRGCPVKVVNHDKYITVTHMKLVPEYIHMKPSKEHDVVVPKYVPYPVPSKPIKIEVAGPPRYHYHDVKKYKYIQVPTPGKPHIVVKKVPVRVPAAPKIIHEQTVEVVHQRHFNCANGFSNWFFGWSQDKKDWCCSHEKRGCPGTWHGHMHLVTHVTGHIGHAHDNLYDCNAGFSGWMQGWSDSKKAWCCEKEHRGCAPHHCDGEVSDWTQAKRDWCCDHFQKGCPETTLSPYKCDAPCTHKGETATCADRLSWAQHHLFSGRGNACALAYSQVQVDCDVCRACSIGEAGCTVHVDTSPAFDCNAALNNFFRAWSPAKKHWCCTQQGKGCEGTSPPHVDPGFGMVWKRNQVNGYWTWIAVSGGSKVQSLPYDCHAGLTNSKFGWSGGKKAWCCANQHLGCGGGIGGAGGATYVTHHTVTYVTHGGGAGGAVGAAGAAGAAGAGGHPPGVAAAGMVWHWSHAGGEWHWVQQHLAGSPEFDCNAGFDKWKVGWSKSKKSWCCHNIGKGCL